MIFRQGRVRLVPPRMTASCPKAPRSVLTPALHASVSKTPGTKNLASGDVYMGDWDRGKRHGTGICTYASGGVYDGEWFDDKQHGFGVFDYPNGDHFEGQWVSGLKEGQGVHFYFDKGKKVHTKRYDGEWVQDVPKCGAYVELPPDPLAPASQETDPLPALQLHNPDGVLSAQLHEVRSERAMYRSNPAQLEDHFTPEELDALQAAFERIDVTGTGSLRRDELASAFVHVGMSPTEDSIRAVLAKMQKHDAKTFTFADFALAADLLSPVEQ